MPHGGMFRIEDPLTKHPIEGTMFNMLYDKAVAYRKANSIPIGLEFEEEIEAEICQPQIRPFDELVMAFFQVFVQLVRRTRKRTI